MSSKNKRKTKRPSGFDQFVKVLGENPLEGVRSDKTMFTMRFPDKYTLYKDVVELHDINTQPGIYTYHKPVKDQHLDIPIVPHSDNI